MDKIWQGFDNCDLYLGSYIAAKNFKDLANANVKAVITIAEGIKVAYPTEMITEHLVINAIDMDTYDIKQHFDQCKDFIDKHLQHGSVLVHCIAGVSRSSSIIIAYLMKINCWSLERAYKFAHSKRNKVSPNPGFLK